MIIEFNVNNQRLTRFTSGVVASNSYRFLKFQFNFRKGWISTSLRVANFSYRGRNYPVELDVNNQCYVPKEVIYAPEFKVSLYGGGITTNTIRIPVEDSDIGDYNEQPSYDALINKLSAIVDELNETKADSITYNEEDKTIQLESNGIPIGNAVELHDCGIDSFDVDENENITITLSDGRAIDLGQIEGASGATFTPHIDERKILTWTNDKGLPNPPATDLNPFDEWEIQDETETEYIWEEE